MTNTEHKELRDLIVEAMKISARKFILKKKSLGQRIVVSENGVIRVIEAEEMK